VRRSLTILHDSIVRSTHRDTFSHDILIQTIVATLARTPDARVHLVSGFHTGRAVIERALDRFAYRGLVLDDAFPATELHVVEGREEPWREGREDGPIAERNQWLLRVRLKWKEEALS
jgi:hypothetical protein